MFESSNYNFNSTTHFCDIWIRIERKINNWLYYIEPSTSRSLLTYRTSSKIIAIWWFFSYVYDWFLIKWQRSNNRRALWHFDDPKRFRKKSDTNGIDLKARPDWFFLYTIFFFYTIRIDWYDTTVVICNSERLLRQPGCYLLTCCCFLVKIDF